MKRKICIWQFIGFITVSLIGTLLHFLYDWTGNNFIALFSAVSESTWEHMKLLFFPIFVFDIVESFYIGKDYENFWCIKFIGTIIGLLTIPTLFYTLNGIFGTTPAWINISIFFISTAAAFIVECMLFRKGNMPCKISLWAFSALCLIAIAFGIFTFMPPDIPLFRDPVVGELGLKMY